MNKYILHILQAQLLKMGSHLSLRSLWKFQMIINYLRLGRFYRDNNFYSNARLRNRIEIFDFIINNVFNERILYLEFGVYKGDCIKYFSSKLNNPTNRFYGFDSFEGLPDDFDVNGPVRKGAFDVKGEVPKIEDDRIIFYKGWFDNVLPYITNFPLHDRLILIMDADLYSSTIFVLRQIDKLIKSGDYIYFDDMSHVEHDPRAFETYIKETNKKFELICTDMRKNNVLFKCLQ